MHPQKTDTRGSDWIVTGDFYEKRVLIIGGGNYSLPLRIGSQANAVFVVDEEVERLKYVSRKCREFGIDSVTPVHCELDAIPFEAARFDSIVVGGVSKHRFSMRSSKFISILEDAYELLVNEGDLYIPAENRYDLAPLFLDGQFQETISRLLRSYRTSSLFDSELTALSEREYRSILRKVGFRVREVHYSFPSLSSPSVIHSDEEELTKDMATTVMEVDTELRSLIPDPLIGFLCQFIAVSGGGSTIAPGMIITSGKR